MSGLTPMHGASLVDLEEAVTGDLHARIAALVETDPLRSIAIIRENPEERAVAGSRPLRGRHDIAVPVAGEIS